MYSPDLRAPSIRLSPLAWTRLVSVATVCVVAAVVPGQRAWSSLVLSIGFGHYALALWYSRRSLPGVVTKVSWWIAFLVLIAIAALLYIERLPLIVYFAVHHVFNEVYIADRGPLGGEPDVSRGLRVAAILLNTAIYVAVLRNDVYLSHLDQRIVFGFLIAAVVLFVVAMVRNHRAMTLPQCIDRCLFEAIGFAAVAASFFVEITFLQVVLYHFVFWMLFPVPRLRDQGTPAVVRYIVATIAVTAVFLALSPLGWNRQAVWSSDFYALFVLLSYAHITLSFALSDAQPRWIRQVFRRQTAPA